MDDPVAYRTHFRESGSKARKALGAQPEPEICSQRALMRLATSRGAAVSDLVNRPGGEPTEDGMDTLPRALADT